MNKKLVTVVAVAVIAAVSIGLLLNSHSFKKAYKPYQTDNYEHETDEQASAGQGEEAQGFVKLDGQGEVNVAVDLLNLSKDIENYLVFEIVLNTHSVNLDNIELGRLSSVKNSDGLTVNKEITWEKKGGSGHHIYGFLKVPKKYGDKKIAGESTEYIQLEIKGLTGEETRKFTWNKDELKNLIQ